MGGGCEGLLHCRTVELLRSSLGIVSPSGLRFSQIARMPFTRVFEPFLRTLGGLWIGCADSGCRHLLGILF